MLPSRSVATQRDCDGHERPVRRSVELPLSTSPSVSLQTGVPAAGLVDVNTLSPGPATATQRDVDAQATLRIASLPRLVNFQAAVPPVGFVDVTTLPESSPATHNEVDGHDIAKRWRPVEWPKSKAVFEPQAGATVVAVAAAAGTKATSARAAAHVANRSPLLDGLTPARR